jgi:predicted ATP-dependent serine protease
MANLYLRKQHMEEAVGELKKALNFRKRVVVPYLCTHCHHQQIEWSGRCRRCGLWNTYAPPGLDAAKTEAERATSRLRTVPYQGIASPFETV